MKRKKQPEESPTPYAKMLEKEMGRVDFELTAEEIERRIRGFDPYPTVYAWYRGKQLKLFRAEVAEGKENAALGEIIAVTDRGFTVQFKDRGLLILEVQPEGKKRMDAPAYLRGARMTAGEMLSDHG